MVRICKLQLNKEILENSRRIKFGKGRGQLYVKLTVSTQKWRLIWIPRCRLFSIILLPSSIYPSFQITDAPWKPSGPPLPLHLHLHSLLPASPPTLSPHPGLSSFFNSHFWGFLWNLWLNTRNLGTGSAVAKISNFLLSLSSSWNHMVVRTIEEFWNWWHCFCLNMLLPTIMKIKNCSQLINYELHS